MGLIIGWSLSCIIWFALGESGVNGVNEIINFIIQKDPKRALMELGCYVWLWIASTDEVLSHLNTSNTGFVLLTDDLIQSISFLLSSSLILILPLAMANVGCVVLFSFNELKKNQD